MFGEQQLMSLIKSWVPLWKKGLSKTPEHSYRMCIRGMMLSFEEVASELESEEILDYLLKVRIELGLATGQDILDNHI